MKIVSFDMDILCIIGNESEVERKIGIVIKRRCCKYKLFKSFEVVCWKIWIMFFICIVVYIFCWIFFFLEIFNVIRVFVFCYFFFIGYVINLIIYSVVNIKVRNVI